MVSIFYKSYFKLSGDMEGRNGSNRSFSESLDLRRWKTSKLKRVIYMQVKGRRYDGRDNNVESVLRTIRPETQFPAESDCVGGERGLVRIHEAIGIGRVSQQDDRLTNAGL